MLIIISHKHVFFNHGDDGGDDYVVGGSSVCGDDDDKAVDYFGVVATARAWCSGV